MDTTLTKYTKLTSTQRKELLEILDDYDEPQTLLYEVIGLLNAKNSNYNKIKQDLIDYKIGWKSCIFEEFHSKRLSEDQMLTKPPEIREGEIECPKCHQKKTLIVEMQTRSADEGYTYYIHCFNPKCMKITK